MRPMNGAAAGGGAERGPAVRGRGPFKRVGAVTAPACLDPTVPRGAFYAFLGPNGAGKSTTLGVLTGLYRPDAGEVLLLGERFEGAELALRARVGSVPEELSLFERLTGRQQLTFSGRMFGLSGAESA